MPMVWVRIRPQRRASMTVSAAQRLVFGFLVCLTTSSVSEVKQYDSSSNIAYRVKLLWNVSSTQLRNTYTVKRPLPIKAVVTTGVFLKNAVQSAGL